MGDFFLRLFNLSVNASYLVLAVLLARLLLKKAPKWVNCILWGIVGLRLVFPFEIESFLSLIPSPEFVPDSMVYTNGAANVTGGEALSYIGNNPVDYSLGIDGGRLVFNEITAPDADAISPLLIATNVLSIVWVVGVAVMLVCSFISFMKVKKSVREAMHVQDNIYLCDNISTPFILGIIKPKIYLPSSLYKEDVLYVIDHENAHIKRLDHLWKPLGYLLLTVYWFNPVMWLAYIFLCKDIELACDEKVIRELDKDSKKEYSNALINCSSQRRLISACPLAFGETGVKNRIKSVLSYKKPAFWVIIIALVLCVAVSVGFLTVPLSGTASNILNENGYTIVSQKEEAVYLNLPVDAVTDEIYNEDGQIFKENEIVVFENVASAHSLSQTNIYLTNVIARETRIDLYFRFSYNELRESGIIYSGYKHTEQGYPYTVDVKDVNSVYIDGEHYYENDVATGFLSGPNDSKGSTEFGVSVSKDAFLKAKESFGFEIFCTKTGYEKNSQYRLIDDDLCRFIEETILEKEGWTTTQDKFSCVSFIPLKAEKVKGNTKVYLCAQWNEYEMVNGTMVFSGEKTPHLATVTIKSDGSGYSLVDYWSLDGYKSSVAQIQEHFPEKYWEEAYNGIGYYYDVLHMKNQAKANEFFAGRTKDYTGEYIFYGSREAIKPTLVLKENNSFVFNYSHLSSEFLTGKYEMQDGYHLMLYAEKNKSYCFTVTDEGFVFDAFNSSEIPEYKVSADSSETYCPVPDNAVFIEKQAVGANSYFDATVLEVNENSILVEPFPDEPVCKSANKLSVSTRLSSSMNVPYLREGDEIRIVYDGMIQETFPGQINGTIAIYMLESVVSDELSYSLGGDGIKYIEYMSRETTDELSGETSEYSQKITEVEKIQHFVELFNEILATSSIDELDTPEYPDEALPDIAFINVHYVDGSVAKIVLPGYERVRLGVNERRLISSYERELLVESLVDSKQKKIEAIVSGTLGRVELTDKEFLNKSYTLTCDVSYLELTRLFGEAPYTESWDGIETYYYFNDEYVLFIEEGIQVSLRKISDPDYRHTIA